jgi:hypothetical protein
MLKLPLSFAILFGCLLMNTSFAQTRTQVVVLGTGTPVADPDRSGPAVALVVNDRAYLVDCGPGVVRRAAAAERNGIKALHVQNITTVFFTHLHSDHTLGYPDLILSPWVLGRTEPLAAYGPKGLQDMTDNIEKAWRKDIDVRRNGLEHANATGYKVNVHEISPGVVFQDANVKVTAFLVKHGSCDTAFGYRFDTARPGASYSLETRCPWSPSSRRAMDAMCCCMKSTIPNEMKCAIRTGRHILRPFIHRPKSSEKLQPRPIQNCSCFITRSLEIYRKKSWWTR